MTTSRAGTPLTRTDIRSSLDAHRRVVNSDAYEIGLRRARA
jgi:hypothetical protein